MKQRLREHNCTFLINIELCKPRIAENYLRIIITIKKNLIIIKNKLTQLQTNACDHRSCNNPKESKIVITE